MMMENDTRDIVMLTSNFTAERLLPPRFSHIGMVKVIVLSAMFLVSVSANSAVLACIVRRWHCRRHGHSTVNGATKSGGHLARPFDLEQ